MPDFSIGVQLGVELTRAFGTPVVRKAAQSAYDSILALARNLRLSGSDLLVEADLADVLGRAKIEPNLERRFRTDVLQAIEVKPIQQGSVLALSTGAGPTLTEASSRTSQSLMASVIQLSFLGWVHDRISLASTLDDCLNKRFEMGIPEARPSPGFNGIVNALEACSSQTSEFDWFLYIDPVRNRLQSAKILPPKTQDETIRLSTSVLRACLDCLYIVQRVPEERFMIVNEPDGMLTLIVWAHYLLGLSVLVVDRRSSRKVGFPKDDCPNPSIIVEHNGLYGRSSSVSVLDSNRDEIIKIGPELDDASSPMEARERLKLGGYGTIMLCRHIGESLDLFIQEPDHSALVEGAQVVIAMARLISQRLVRTTGNNEDVLEKCSIDRRKIYDAARVYFAHPYNPDLATRVRYEEASMEGHLEMMAAATSWRGMELPAAFRQPKYRDQHGESLISPVAFTGLAITLLCIAAVVGIDDCTDIKLVLEDNFETEGDFMGRIGVMRGKTIPFRSHDLFAHMSRLLLGRELALAVSAEDFAGDGDCFMVSDFGWTISLPTYGDSDPFTIVRDSLFIRKGVVTNAKTMERKNRVRDALPPGIEITGNTGRDVEWIRDRGKETYAPRCVSPVHDRVEYYGSRDNGFHLAIKLRGKHIEHLNQRGEPYWFEVNQSCRTFFEGLWKTVTAPPCPHRQNGLAVGESDAVKLGLGVATAGGVWSWSGQENGKKGTPVPERVVVVLVKGDARARWLAVGDTFKRERSRKTMLRGKLCCENCAVEAAAARPGKWFVII